MTRSLPDLIAHAIERSDLTQGQIANELGVQQGTISKWKLGTTRPDPKRFGDISRVLDIPRDVLMEAWTLDVAQEGEPDLAVTAPDESTIQVEVNGNERPGDLEAEERMQYLRRAFDGATDAEAERLLLEAVREARDRRPRD